MSATPEQLEKLYADLDALQTHYTDFRDFYWDCSVELLGFEPTDEQLDIAAFVAKGPLYSMVQAQRGEAKTTITGCYAVWRLIHAPTTRVLIVSAGTPMAKQIATWCINILNGMEELTILRCDKTHPGARNSVEAYDVNHLLKGADKSPSIACLGITSNMNGYRADLLIADDIESGKNAQTAIMRERLRQLTRDFTSINQKGKILYLGTPQSVDSIYNDLPARGFAVRVWPGRYPTKAEEQNYGPHLAPLLVARMTADPSLRTGGGLLGDRGKPTDPGMMSEETLTKKELDQGAAYFNLQYMLDTALSDADRFPLKIKDLMVYSFDNTDAPSKYIWTNDVNSAIPSSVGCAVRDTLYRPAKVSSEFLPYTYRLMSIDPAGGGQNGDETGVAIIYAVNGYIMLMHVTGIPGGTDPGKLAQIVKLAQEWDLHNILIEKNFGNGAYAVSLEAALQQAEHRATVETVWSTGQKEQRIVNALEPVIGSHRLIINQPVLDHDVLTTQRYSVESRPVFQFLHQLKHLTRERGSLSHDDRLEAVAQGVTHVLKALKQQADGNAPPPPVDRFKGFQIDPRTGQWRLASRVQPLVSNRTSGGLNIKVMDKFK